MTIQGVDLLVLEGMGRAIHTNLYTKFKCECLKVAVLKNKWLAQHLGGKSRNQQELMNINDSAFYSQDLFGLSRNLNLMFPFKQRRRRL